MEVICIETTAFYELVNRVVTHMLELHSEPPFKWVSTERAMQLLHIKSKTTLQKLRDEGRIRFSKPHKKVILYDQDSINDYLEAHAYEPFYRKRK